MAKQPQKPTTPRRTPPPSIPPKRSNAPQRVKDSPPKPGTQKGKGGGNRPS